jgi:kynurenine 3-monooxygenase
MVPFYGQGMNCGFEDCLVLDEIFSKTIPKGSAPSEDQMKDILDEYSTTRNPDAEAMCDLALFNYIEMRHGVTTSFYLFRKRLEGVLHRIFPKTIIPLYTMVSFSRTPYKKALEKYKAQTPYFEWAHFLYRWGAFISITGLILYRAPGLKIFTK